LISKSKFTDQFIDKVQQIIFIIHKLVTFNLPCNGIWCTSVHHV